MFLYGALRSVSLMVSIVEPCEGDHCTVFDHHEGPVSMVLLEEGNGSVEILSASGKDVPVSASGSYILAK